MKRILMVGVIVVLSGVLGAVSAAPAGAEACSDKGCNGDKCESASGYWCEKLGNGCYGGHCAVE